VSRLQYVLHVAAEQLHEERTEGGSADVQAVPLALHYHRQDASERTTQRPTTLPALELEATCRHCGFVTATRNNLILSWKCAW